MGCSFWQMQRLITYIPLFSCVNVYCRWALLTDNMSLLWMNYISVTAGVGLCYSKHDLQLLRVLCNQKHIICACRTTTVDVSYPLTKAVHSKFHNEAVNIHLVETSRNDTSLSNTLEHLEATTQTTFPFAFGSETRVKFSKQRATTSGLSLLRRVCSGEWYGLLHRKPSAYPE